MTEAKYIQYYVRTPDQKTFRCYALVDEVFMNEFSTLELMCNEMRRHFIEEWNQ